MENSCLVELITSRKQSLKSDHQNRMFLGEIFGAE